MDSVSLNYTFLPRAEAKIPIDDRGFLFGDGVFETILVAGGFPYLIQDHLRRLIEGLGKLRIDCDTDNLEQEIYRVITANEMDKGIVRVTITRGMGSAGYLPSPKIHGEQPTVLITTRPLPPAPPESVDLTLTRIRRIPGSSLPSMAKHMQGLNSTLARIEAAEKNCFEALMLDVRGYITECSSYNIFWSKGRTLYTPHLDTGCLEGITRQRVIRLSGYKVHEGYYTLKDLLRSDGMFLTNSAHLVVPVHRMPEISAEWKNSDKLAKIYMMSLEQDIASDTGATRERYRQLGWAQQERKV